MFASVINYGSSLIFGAPEESQRVPATDGDSSSFTEKFEDSWVVIDQVSSLFCFYKFVFTLLKDYKNRFPEYS